MACTKQFHRVLFKYKPPAQNRLFAAQLQEGQELVTVDHLKDTNEGIAVLALNRAKQKNALSKSFVSIINDAVTTVADSSAKVLVIKSAVPGIFCAGADLKERLSMSHKEVSQFTYNARALIAQIHFLPIPVIAAVDGIALGGGMEIALASDIRIASTSAKLGLVETRLAIIPGAGGTALLPRLISPSVAKELIFTARVVDGGEGKNLGFINHAVEQNEDGNAAYLKSLEIAREILPNGPVGIRMAKFAVNRGSEVDINTAFAIEGACYAQTIPTQDRIEGLKAFGEKRPPKYIGK